MSFKKKSALVQNRRWIMSILDVCCLSETKTFEQFSDFLAFTLSSKNSHQFGQNQPTDKFHHSIESWEWGEEDRTWAGGLRRLWRPPKRRNISLPNSLATVVGATCHILPWNNDIINEILMFLFFYMNPFFSLKCVWFLVTFTGECNYLQYNCYVNREM